MSDSIDLLSNLLKHIQEYSDEHGNSDIKQFSIYLKDKVIIPNSTTHNSGFNKEDYNNYTNYPEIELSALLTALYRFSKHYVKKAFQNTSINTIDEFGFLASLLREKSLLKKELINKHLLETSSGSEILKRLIKNGLIYEYPDERDRRAKRVSLTDTGRKEIFNVFDDMYKVSQIISGNLSKNELRNALQILNKLNYFHHEVHKTQRNSDLYELHSSLIEKTD